MDATGRPAQAVVIAVTGDPPPWLTVAIDKAGARYGPLKQADAVIHYGGPAALAALPQRIRWVQLPNAGVEKYFRTGVIDTRRVWTSAAGVYADTVAEHAVGMLLAGVRGLVDAGREHRWRPDLIEPRITGLAGSVVAIVGAGGIGRRIVDLLAPFGVTVLAVNRRGAAVAGAARTLRAGEADAAFFAQADHAVLAAPATDATRHLLGAAELAALRPHSWVVNIARGSLIDTEALLAALRERRIAGAALDVTDPEPLPDGHPLWTTPGVLITPHTANPAHRAHVALAARIRENIVRFASGRELLGVVDVKEGY